MFDERIEEDAEGVGDAVEDEVAHETGEHDDPTPTTIGWGWKLDQGNANVIIVKRFVLESPMTILLVN